MCSLTVTMLNVLNPAELTVVLTHLGLAVILLLLSLRGLRGKHPLGRALHCQLVAYLLSFVGMCAIDVAAFFLLREGRMQAAVLLSQLYQVSNVLDVCMLSTFMLTACHYFVLTLGRVLPQSPVPGIKAAIVGNWVVALLVAAFLALSFLALGYSPATRLVFYLYNGLSVGVTLLFVLRITWRIQAALAAARLLVSVRDRLAKEASLFLTMAIALRLAFKFTQAVNLTALLRPIDPLCRSEDNRYAFVLFLVYLFCCLLPPLTMKLLLEQGVAYLDKEALLEDTSSL
jgi:hypothetical protein